jgi:cell division protein FtsB
MEKAKVFRDVAQARVHCDMSTIGCGGDGLGQPRASDRVIVLPLQQEDVAMGKSTLAIAALLACASAASAQPAPPPVAQPAPDAAKAPPASEASAPRQGRFSFNRVDDGFLRLDNQTGQVAYCNPHAVGWSCQAVPEDRAALDKEIARLKDEVVALKAEVALLREPPPPRPPGDLTPPPPASQAQPPSPQPTPPPSAADSERERTKLREDLERARLAFENAWRRLVEMINNLQKDLARKGSG